MRFAQRAGGVIGALCDGVEGEEIAGFMGNEWCWVGGGQGEECCECQYLACGAEGWEMHFGYEAVETVVSVVSIEFVSGDKW